MIMARLEGLLTLMQRRKYLWLLVWFLIFFAGLDLIWNPPKGAGLEYLALGIIFLVLGFAFLVLLLVPREKLKIETKEGNLATALLNVLTVRGRLKPFFPLLGMVLIALDILYNLYISTTPELLTHDSIVLLFGVVMIAYNFIPNSYERERDFIFLFFAGLVVILVIPLLLARVIVGNVDDSVAMYSAYLLAPEVSGFLNLVGIPSSVDWLTITFTTQSQDQISVYISTACSGIYSFSIFASAFLSFILTEYDKIDRKVVLLMGLGILTAYVANILRMVVIVLVGYYTYTPEAGLQAMLVAHSNAGWIIFLIWIGLFWFLMYRFLIRTEEPVDEVKEEKAVTRCAICGDIMKVDIPGTRCECGQFLHLECLEDTGKCPKCGAEISVKQDAISVTIEA
jgi:archaeosortase C (PEF-CTERM variant)